MDKIFFLPLVCIWLYSSYLLTCPHTFFNGQEGELLNQSENISSLCLRFQYLGHIGVIISISGYFGQEYTHTSLRTTLLANASRINLLFTKKAVTAITILLSNFLSGLFCLFVAFCQYNAAFSEMNSFIQAFFYTNISWLTLGFLSASLVILSRSMVIPYCYFFPLVLGLNQLLLTIGKWAKFLPDLAGMNLFLIPNQNIFLAAANGIFVQLCLAILFGLFSTYLFCQRDNGKARITAPSFTFTVILNIFKSSERRKYEEKKSINC